MVAVPCNAPTVRPNVAGPAWILRPTPAIVEAVETLVPAAKYASMVSVRSNVPTVHKSVAVSVLTPRVTHSTAVLAEQLVLEEKSVQVVNANVPAVFRLVETNAASVAMGMLVARQPALETLAAPQRKPVAINAVPEAMFV